LVRFFKKGRDRLAVVSLPARPGAREPAGYPIEFGRNQLSLLLPSAAWYETSKKGFTEAEDGQPTARK
jgi:hypothetical protein